MLIQFFEKFLGLLHFDRFLSIQTLVSSKTDASSHIFIFELMAIATLIFGVAFVFSLFGQWKKSAASILKFAPSVMTALGLLGTFLGLISSLGTLSQGTVGEIDITKISKFMTELENVFQYSALGITLAVLFIFLNLIISGLHSYIAKNEKEYLIDEQNERSKLLNKLNHSNNKELTSQTAHLFGLKSQLESFQNQINDNQAKQLQYLQGLYRQDKQQYETQANTFNQLSQSINAMSSAINGMSGFDTNALGDIIGQKIEEALRQPLADLTHAISQNNSDTIKKLLEDLKDEVLTPIKTEIQATTQSTNQVIQAVNASQSTNEQLIGKLGDVTTQMDSFVHNTGTLVSNMTGAVERMETLQSDQERMMSQFTQDLSDNLNTINPAIIGAMDVATLSMTDAINQTTTSMNTAMQGVIDNIANKVVDELGGTLKQFDTNMDSHLNRMNSELEETGKRASDLIDTSATKLKETLGEIDSTLDKSSQKLQEELKAFRDEYEVSLTKFFTEQNKQLEQTLGVQAKALQDTADQLKGQFEKMSDKQEKLNEFSQRLINDASDIYEPLLTQMGSIAERLNSGQTQILKGIKQASEHTQTVSDELKKLGDKMPQEFTKAFALLNDAYTDKFNTSNQMLQKAMNEMITAASGLVNAASLVKQDDE